MAPEADAAGARGGQAAVGLAELSVLNPAVAAALAEELERSAVPLVWAVGGAVVLDGFEARAAAWWCVGGRRRWRCCGIRRWGGS